MNTFRELIFWSASHNCDCTRISHVGLNQEEHWVIIELSPDPVERKKLEELAEKRLLEASLSGEPPGEIKLSKEAN